MSNQEQTLRQFFADQIACTDPAVGAFVLGHEAAGVFQRLDTVRFGESPRPEAPELAKRFFHKALRHAEGYGSVQRYAVVAYDEEGAPVSQEPIRVMSEDALVSMAPTEPPTPAGAVKATLRHLEGREKSAMKMLQWNLQTLERVNHNQGRRIEALETQNAKLQDRFLQSVDAIEELKSRAHERKLRQAREEDETKVLSWLFEQIQTFVPIMGAHLTGASDVAKLVESLDMEKLKAIYTSLNEDQRRNFDNLLSRAKLGQDAERKLIEQGLREPGAAASDGGNGKAADDPTN